MSTQSDPTIKQEFANKKKDADAEKVRKAYADKLELAGKDLGRQWADLALWCRRGKLEKEGVAIPPDRASSRSAPLNAKSEVVEGAMCS